MCVCAGGVSGGTVGKYIGDAIMAFWNSPAAVEGHAAVACAAALEQQALLAALRRRLLARGLPPLRARMGLSCGTVLRTPPHPHPHQSTHTRTGGSGGSGGAERCSDPSLDRAVCRIRCPAQGLCARPQIRLCARAWLSPATSLWLAGASRMDSLSGAEPRGRGAKAAAAPRCLSAPHLGLFQNAPA